MRWWMEGSKLSFTSKEKHEEEDSMLFGVKIWNK